MIFGDFGLASQSLPAVVTPAYAQSTQRMAGFADIVENGKPAVISVKVGTNTTGANLAVGRDNPLRGSPFEDFFRRFARPGGAWGLPAADGLSLSPFDPCT